MTQYKFIRAVLDEPRLIRQIEREAFKNDVSEEQIIKTALREYYDD